MQTSFRHRWGRSLATAGVALVVGLACGTSQGTPTTAQNVPGVTSNEILIGTTTPLSGAASVYASISKGVTAYFNYVNDHGGINGRKVTYKVYDDAYDPSKSVPLVRQLITQDQVFAVFNELGTPVNLATRDYINQQGVPDLFVATGSSHWGSDYKQFPWTIGYQPDYVSESKIYAKDILSNHPNAKIGVLYQNDDYGKDYLNGLQAGLGSKASSMIIDTETYEANAADVTSQTAAIKAKGADLLFIAATPKFAGQAIAGASQLNWKPAIYLNSVSNQVSTVKASIAASKPDAAEGMTSTVYLKNAADQAKWGSDPGMQLYMSIMSKYCAGCDAVNDGNYIYGMSVAWVFQQVMQKAGRDGVTRQNVMNIARNMSYKNSPFLLPGISVLTNGTNQFPVTQEALEHWQGTGWVVDNTIINAR
ncbi:MAG TPA: ABC transporter substrate-binding protein [Candidatus Dormibacteraeota bacterium]|nr:ABC transporter substrate-binding protein [Candidatus Dormibacteraeota bacterium]